MPLSVFRGRVVEPGEPLWNDADRDWAVALHLVESSTCSGCGQDRAESTEADAEGTYTTTAVRCFSCQTLTVEQRKFSEAGGKSDGLTFHVHKR